MNETPHEFQVLEDAVLAALQPLKTEGVPILEYYDGQFSDEKAMTRLIDRFPAVLVIAEGMEADPHNRVDKAKVAVTIYVLGRHLRGPNKAARRTDEPGVYAILRRIRSLINARTVAAGWDALTWAGEGPRFVGPEASVSIYEANYSTRAALGRT